MSDRIRVLDAFENPESNWKEKAEENINRFRKGIAKIKVVDQNGNPVSNAKISVSQLKHEFRFGANCFLLDELETPEKNEIYKKKFAQIFNMATLPFYWCDLEPTEGKTRYTIGSPKIYRRPTIDLCLQYCEENGIEPREHALAYDHFFPEWLAERSVDEIKEALELHMKEIADLYKDKIRTIEVTNEMFWPKWVTPLYKESDYVEWCFKTARKYFPDNQLVVNECTRSAWGRTEYFDYLLENFKKGAPMDAIGLQCHIFFEQEKIDVLYNPEQLVKELDMYAQFNKPLQLTEITIPAYSYNEEDEEIQAKIIEYLYTIWFSHPNLEQIIYWNLVDGYAAFVEQGDMTGGENQYYGGLLRFDMSEKPSYKVLDNLINKKWHTEEDIQTNEDGIASFDGFYGDYEVKVSTESGEIVESINFSSKGLHDYTIII